MERSNFDINNFLVIIFLLPIINLFSWINPLTDQIITIKWNLLIVLLQLLMYILVYFLTPLSVVQFVREIIKKTKAHMFLIFTLNIILALSGYRNANLTNFKLSIQLIYIIFTIFILSSLHKPSEFFKRLVKMLNILMLVAVFYGIFLNLFHNGTAINKGVNYQTLTIGKLTFYQIVMGKKSVRVASFFANPNHYGLLLAITLSFNIYDVFLISKLENIKSLSLRDILKISFLLFGLVKSESRGAFLLLITYISMMFFYTNDRNSFVSKRNLFIISCLIVVLSIVFIKKRGTFFGTSNRIHSWIFASQYKPGLIGFGVGTMDKVLINNGLSTLHNFYLSSWYDTGLFGLMWVLFYWIFPSVLVTAKWLRRDKISLNPYLIPYILGCISFIPHQLIENNLLQYNIYTHFWFLGLLYLQTLCKHRSSRKSDTL